MLTSDEQKVVSDLVIANIGDTDVVEEFDFVVKCSECTNEEIDALDQLCANPSAVTQIGECLRISVRYSVMTESYTISGECM